MSETAIIASLQPPRQEFAKPYDQIMALGGEHHIKVNTDRALYSRIHL